eukprot:jgi/Picre1/28265/NNA_003671.t1
MLHRGQNYIINTLFNTSSHDECISSRRKGSLEVGHTKFCVWFSSRAQGGCFGSCRRNWTATVSFDEAVPYVSELSLYDIAGTPGVAADVSHINSKASVKGYAGEDELGAALEGADVVIIPAGVPRKPGMTRDDLFKINAGIVKSLVEACGKHCPKALLNIISNPVNSTVPIAAETLKKMGCMTKSVFWEACRSDYSPLFSQAVPNPTNPLSADVIDALTKRTQDGGTEVVQAKAGKGSATLSMAYAGALFADACLRGLNGDEDVIECSYVASSVTDLPFFSSKVKLGRHGVEEVYGLGELNEYEQAGLKAMMPELKSSIDKGVEFAHNN